MKPSGQRSGQKADFPKAYRHAAETLEGLKMRYAMEMLLRGGYSVAEMAGIYPLYFTQKGYSAASSKKGVGPSFRVLVSMEMFKVLPSNFNVSFSRRVPSKPKA